MVDVLGEEEDETVRRSGDERKGEGHRREQDQSAAKRRSHGTEDGHDVVGGRAGDGEAVRFGGPAADEWQQRQGNDGQEEQSSKPQGLRGQTVDDCGEPGADPVTGGHECEGLGPARRVGLFGGDHFGERVGGTEERSTTGEDHHEPPVTGTRRREHRSGESEPHRRDQHAVATESVGHRRQGQPAERRQPNDGESDAELRSRESGLVGQRGPVHQVAEGSRHAAQGRDHAELSESRGEGREDGAQDHAVIPLVQSRSAQRRGIGRPGHQRVRSDALTGRTSASFRRRANQNGL